MRVILPFPGKVRVILNTVWVILQRSEGCSSPHSGTRILRCACRMTASLRELLAPGYVADRSLICVNRGTGKNLLTISLGGAISMTNVAQCVAAVSLTVIVTFGVQSAAAGVEVPQTAHPTAVADVETRLQPGQIQMGGELGRRMADCMANLITAWDLDRLIKPFRDKTDGRDNQWRGDYWGKWFTALAWGYAHQPTPEHRRLLDRAVKELIATQGPDGNIGTFAGETRLVGRLRHVGPPVRHPGPDGVL